MGTDDRIVVQPDGAFRSSGKLLGEQSGRVSAAQFAQLSALLKNWARLEVTGRPPDDAADLFEHTLTYNNRTLRWADATPGIPSELADIVSLLVEAVQPPAR
ncbi:MAG: hypothetical protein AB1716_20995 [Planctomycetota bacterium]